MIANLFIATGIVFWALVSFFVIAGILSHPRVRRLLGGPAVYPYGLWAVYRAWGLIVVALARLGVPRARRIPTEVTAAFRSTRLPDWKHLRDVLLEVDALPTVQRGLAAIGLKSIFDVPTRGVHRVPSPYSDRLQYPAYYIPGIPARTFYDPSEFEWVKPLEEAYPSIRRELLQILGQDGKGFKSYMTDAQMRLEGWNSFNFFFYGKKFEENCALCPETTAVLESLPRLERDHVMFSALNPHSHIPPHTGPMNGIIRGHLALIVPTGCFIRVGKDERTWNEGNVLIFDDSFEHEVWNHSGHVRIVLFMNFWHPCLSASEVAVLERFRSAYERSPLGRVHEDNQAARRAHDVAMDAVQRASREERPMVVPQAGS